jgi:hypothetical protein
MDRLRLVREHHLSLPQRVLRRVLKVHAEQSGATRLPFEVEGFDTSVQVSQAWYVHTYQAKPGAHIPERTLHEPWVLSDGDSPSRTVVRHL